MELDISKAIFESDYRNLSIVSRTPIFLDHGKLELLWKTSKSGLPLRIGPLFSVVEKTTKLHIGWQQIALAGIVFSLRVVFRPLYNSFSILM
ncbi:hypothetical protein RHMOL_Rhmol02G0243100 [Rhododendron molle]|uniref:Uncharacterized protein n=1 Tax=Rhododendron molle TaxID=49168 RepID=A0ACC0PWD2_RHOML|nr:hypothetical protein RHMOL_Rhmol02G0243100 [Rhododendron molle]